MKKATAQWSAQLKGECPECGEWVDYTEYKDFWFDLPSEFKVCQNDDDIHVVCPECREDFLIDCKW